MFTYFKSSNFIFVPTEEVCESSVRLNYSNFNAGDSIFVNMMVNISYNVIFNSLTPDKCQQTLFGFIPI